MMKTKEYIAILAAMIGAHLSSIDKAAGQNIDPSTMTVKYLGQKPPGPQPVRFPPEAFSANEEWFYHGPLSFSADGLEMFWGKYTVANPGTVITSSRFSQGRWTPPQTAPFASGNRENCPVYSYASPDTIYYTSSGSILSVTRTNGRWSAPVHIPLPIPKGKSLGLQISITRDETFCLELVDKESGNIDLHFSRLVNGAYSEPERLGDAVNSPSLEICPFIDPDEKYIIFSSNRPGGHGGFDLYFSKKNNDGSWRPAENMGPMINTAQDDSSPYVTEDGKYFFYNAKKTGDKGFNPYWTDARIFNEMKLK